MRRVALLALLSLVGVLLASGVALAIIKVGGPGSDTLIGTNGPDQLAGKGGGDDISGLGGRDTLSGGAGDDFVNGDSGTDTVAGGAGNDLLVDGPIREFQRDVLGGGAGNDIFAVWNIPASRDIVACGTGRDSATVDPKDIVGDDCERVELIS